MVGYNREFLPLPIETTGIPALRSELLALPAPDKLSVLQLYWKGSLMGMIASMKNYSRQSANQRQEELKTVVKKSYQVRTVTSPYFTDQLTHWRQDLPGRNHFLHEFSDGLGGG